MQMGRWDRILAYVLFFNEVPCPPAQRAHAQAGERGGDKLHNVNAECDQTYPVPDTPTLQIVQMVECALN